MSDAKKSGGIKRPILVFSVFAAITIAVMAMSGVSLTPTAPIHNLPDSVRAEALFVCPTTDATFDELANTLSQFRRQLQMIFMFCLMLLFAVAGWAFYQNLIKDKFDKKSYDLTSALAITLFWGTLVVTILMHSPNSFRTVGVRGHEGKFVLCESNTPGARPVRATAIIFHSKISN